VHYLLQCIAAHEFAFWVCVAIVMQLNPTWASMFLLLFAVVNMSPIPVIILGYIVVFVVFFRRTYNIQILCTLNLSDLTSEFHFIIMFETVDLQTICYA
jgi:hypothetical protein